MNLCLLRSPSQLSRAIGVTSPPIPVGLEQKGKSPRDILWPFWGQRMWRAPRLGGMVSSFHRLENHPLKRVFG